MYVRPAEAERALSRWNTRAELSRWVKVPQLHHRLEPSIKRRVPTGETSVGRALQSERNHPLDR
jgi:hypothetical protein